MARKTGQIIGRVPRTYVVRIFVGRDAESKKRKYISKTIHGGLRDAQAHLNKMLGERDLGRNISSSKQTLNQYLTVGSRYARSLDCGPRAFTITRACSADMFVHDSARRL